MASAGASLANVMFMLVAVGGLLLVLLYFVSRQGLASLVPGEGKWTTDILDGLGLSGVLLLVWSAVAPGAGQSGVWSIGAAFVAGQLFLIARLFLRLTRLGAAASLYPASSSSPAS